MKIAPINPNINTLHNCKKNVAFNGNKQNESKIIIDTDGTKYVKVKKWQHDFDNIIGGIACLVLLLEIIKTLSKKWG